MNITNEIRMSSCDKTSNNKYLDCPPRMSDGRHFTDYRPSCHTNNLIRANNAVMNSYEYRLFLTRNANKLIELNRNYACQKNCCGPCKQPYHQGTMLSEQTIQNCNTTTCSVDVLEKKGLGIGRRYDTDSQECSEWPKELPFRTTCNCCADGGSLFNYYNNTDKPMADSFPRKAIPGGGDVLRGGDPEPYNL